MKSLRPTPDLSAHVPYNLSLFLFSAALLMYGSLANAHVCPPRAIHSTPYTPLNSYTHPHLQLQHHHPPASFPNPLLHLAVLPDPSYLFDSPARSAVSARFRRTTPLRSPPFSHSSRRIVIQLLARMPPHLRSVRRAYQATRRQDRLCFLRGR